MARSLHVLLGVFALFGLVGLGVLVVHAPDIIWELIPVGDVFLEREELPVETVLASPHISRSMVVHDRRLGLVSDIRAFPDGPVDRTVGIVGRYGALFTCTGFKPGPYTRLSEYGWEVYFAGADRAGFEGIVDGGTWSGATVYDKDGRALWHPPNEHGINGVAAADFLGIGALQYVVGYNGSGGVSFFDSDFTLIWNEPDVNVWHVAAVPIPGRDTPAIVHTNVDGELILRDIGGAVLSRTALESCSTQFSMTPWPTVGSPGHIVHMWEDFIRVYTPIGNLVASFDASLGEDYGQIHATPVRMNPDAGDYFAVLIRTARRDQAALVIFDDAGERILHEWLGSPTRAIAAMPEPGGDRDVLLVGGHARVWSYRYDAEGTEMEDAA